MGSSPPPLSFSLPGPSSFVLATPIALRRPVSSLSSSSASLRRRSLDSCRHCFGHLHGPGRGTPGCHGLLPLLQEDVARRDDHDHHVDHDHDRDGATIVDEVEVEGQPSPAIMIMLGEEGEKGDR